VRFGSCGDSRLGCPVERSSTAASCRKDSGSRSTVCRGSQPPPSIDPALSSVLKAFYAQMDARALAAPQEVSRRCLWPTRSSAPAAGIFRCGSAARSRARQRQHRIGNFNSSTGRLRIVTVSSSPRPAAFTGRSAIPCSIRRSIRSSVRPSIRCSVSRPAAFIPWFIAGSQSTPSWRSWPRRPWPRTSRCASLRSRCRKRIHPASSIRTCRIKFSTRSRRRSRRRK